MMTMKERAKRVPQSPSPTNSDSTGEPSLLPLHSPRWIDQNESSDESDEGSYWSSPSSGNSSFGLPTTWSSNPQSPGNDREIRSPERNSETLPVFSPHVSRGGSHCNQQTSPRIPLFVFGFILVGAMAIFTSHVKLNTATTQMATLSKHRDELGGKLKKYEKDVRVLEREISAMDIMIQKQHDMGSQASLMHARHQKAMNEMSDLQQRLHDDALKSFKLKKQVQALSRDDIIAKYGNGVHRIEIELVFPDHHRGPTKFEIELAPADIMPHSVHTFLEMTTRGLLDGCSFILNAMHVLKAAPLPYDGTTAADKAKAFSENGLESVAFKEYNEDYPHKKYTVGFAADGSPSFYINTEDNSEIHVGDPCFGRVVSGFDTVQRLESNPTRNGIWFERRIGIRSARLISESSSS